MFPGSGLLNPLINQIFREKNLLLKLMKTKLRPEFTQILEPLEARIAPASAVFTDADGDIVKVTTTKGTNADLQALVDTGNDMGQMKTLDLTSTYAGSDVKFSVTSRGASGDGLVNVWHIKATGFDLGAVEVAGDLSKLTVGDTNYANGSVKSVKVQSIGVNGGATDKVWSMLGNTTSFAVAGDVNGASLVWSNSDALGKLTVTSVTIGGNLIGGGADGSGSILMSTGAGGTADLKAVTVGGSLVATNYHQSGAIIVGDTVTTGAYTGIIEKATIGGSLKGFAGKDYNGTVFAATTLGATTVGGSLKGGGVGSGSVFSAGKIIGDVSVGGSLTGGAGNYSGSVFSNYGSKAVKVGGSLTGNGGAYGGSISSFLGPIGDVTVGSTLSGGSGVYSGSIFGKTGLGKVWVGGSVFGGSNDNAGMIGTSTDGTTIKAKTGDITVMGSLFGGSDFSTGNIEGYTLGNISIAKSLSGGTQAGTGEIYAANTFKSLFIGGSLLGTSKDYSASVRALGTTSTVSFVTIGGSLQGNAGVSSAAINIGGPVTKLTINGDILGGTGTSSASVTVGGAVTTLSIGGEIAGSATMGNDSAYLHFAKVMNGTIGGSFTGGAGTNSGSLLMTDGTSLKITGGITGGTATDSGSLNFGNLTTLSVGTGENTGVSIYGGSAQNSGLIHGANLTTLTLAGNIVGGSAQYTGTVILSKATTATIGGDILGGSSAVSGYVSINAIAGKLTVGGDVHGSDNLSNTGGIFAANAANIEIKGSLIGGNTTMGNVNTSGAVVVNAALTSLTVGGDIKAGTHFSTTTDHTLGAVRAGTIGTMLVKGGLVGADTNSRVLITARGDTSKTTGTNVALTSLTVMGSVSNAMILGGYDTSGTTVNGNGGANGGGAQLGTITINGDFFNGSIATGVSNNTATTGHWADNTNTLLSTNALVASIAKIVIKGSCFAGTQSGIAAEQIKSLSVGGFTVPVAAGAQYFPVNGNFYVQQVIA